MIYLMKNLECIKLKKTETYYNSVYIYKIKFNKVLISFQKYGLIINVTEKQKKQKFNFPNGMLS